MPMAPREMIKHLEENGFVFNRQNGSHRLYINPINGKRVTVPYHAKELKKGTEQAILKQAGLK